LNKHISPVAALVALPLVTVSLVGGCVSSVPNLQPERMVTDAASLDSAIALRDGREPLDVADPLPTLLTRAAAAELAVRNSPAVQAALADVRASLADAEQARLLSNPVLDLNVRFGGESEVIEAGLAQPLIELLRRPAASRAADARLRASAQKAVVATLDELRDVNRAYAAAVIADERLALLDRQAELLDQLLDVADQRQQAGEATTLDVAGFRARRAALDAQAVLRRADRRSARLTLLRLIGRPSGDVELQLEPLGEATPLLAEREYLLAALAARPEVQAATFELAALGEDVTLAGLSPFDGLGVGAELESADETEAGPSISVPIPIFDFGTQRKERARAEVIAARHRLTGVSRQVVEEVRQARTAAVAADEAVAAVTDMLLPLQRERVEQTRAAYRAGFADVTDVLAAEQDLLDADAQLIDARLGRFDAEADLLRATGGVPDDAAPTEPDVPAGNE
jgi:cobalt-zinc-cadmium efflux system outer membrane protein